jgi:outer membrane protein OmpA-like peptidoglycan-associated protein
MTFWCAGCFVTQAQLPGQIRAIPKIIKQNGELLEVEILFDLYDLRIGTSESITYTPIIVSGNEQYALPQLIIKGNTRFKADRRAEALSGRTPEMPAYPNEKINSAVYATEKFDIKKIIPYRVSISHKAEMQNVTLSLREETTGCCNQQILLTQRNLNFDVPGSTAVNSRYRFNYLVPDQESEKNRFEIGTAFLEFPQGGSTINPTFRNNQNELDKINQLISMLLSDPDIQVSNIEMRGYASPEGSAQTNFNLSSQRANAMREYFIRRLTTIPPSTFITGVGGEDWEGLKNLLDNYSVDYREEILSLIQTVQDLDIREQRIRNLGGGEPYRQLFRDLYPKLRRVDCQINYTARSFTVSEGKEKMQVKAKLLSQNEMYQVAHTYSAGSHEFNQALITAGQYFPGSDVANINAAAAALSEGNPRLADEYLKKVQNKNSPAYANSMGVLSIYQGNYLAAEDYLRKAQAGGVVEAEHNLRELMKMRNQ